MRWTRGHVVTALPVAVDALHYVGFDLLNRPLRALLGGTSLVAAIGLLSIYAVFVAALFLLGRLEPEVAPKTLVLRTGSGHAARTTKTTWPDVLFFYPSFGFGMVLLLAAAQIVLAAPVGDGVQAGVVSAALVLLVFHLGAMVRDRPGGLASDQPGYLGVFVPVLLASELALNLSVALWHRFLGLDAAGPTPPAPSLAGFLVAAPLFLFFFAAPRFAMLSRSFTWPGLASALALALWELSEILDEAPLL